jgi:O-antigen/teichoic acid export membrane protein
MLNSIKISLKDTLIYGLGNIAVKIVGLILIPLFTNPKYFSIDDFGVIGVLEISALVLTAFLASALPQSLTRWYWDKEHTDNQKGIFFMTLIMQLVISILFCIVLIPISGTISELIFSKPVPASLITLVILASAIQAVNNIINALMRLQSRSLLYTIANLFKLTSVLLMTLWFILSRKMGLEGIYLAQVIGNILFVLVLLGYTVKNSRVYFDRTVLMSMNAYGFPLLMANISAAMLTVIDRFTLNSLSLLKSVALYTLAFKITSVLKLVIADSIKLAIGPMMFRWMDKPDNKRLYSKMLLYSSYVMMFAIVGISMFSYEIIKVITTSNQYWEAVAIIPILSLSVFFGNMKDITVYGLHIAKKTRIIGLIIILTTLLSLALNILFIPMWDITGAALATLLSQIVYWLACYYFSQKVFFVPYETRKIAILFLVGAVFSFLSLKFNGMNLFPRLTLKTISLISFPFILYFAGFYEKIELQSIKGFIKKWSRLRKFKDNLKSLKDVRDDV